MLAAAFAVISWNSFKVEEYDIYSLIQKTDISDAPTSLEERYDIGMDLSGYTYEILIDEDFIVDIYYTSIHNENITFEFCQMTKYLLQGKRIDAENLLQKPTTIEVNGSIGMYIQYRNGAHHIFWDNGDYFIEVTASCAFSTNELIMIFNSVQKVE